MITSGPRRKQYPDGAEGPGRAWAERLVTERLVLRPWSPDDAVAALGTYGDAEVARWLTPVMDRVRDEAAMRLVLRQWVAQDARMLTPAGHWAVELHADGRLAGGATLLPLPPDDEFEIGWQLRPDAWGHGYAIETGIALARWAFTQGIDQVIALVRPANTRAAATRAPDRHAVGRRDREVSQPTPAGVPPHPR